ncbi:MAG: autotransporter outer rane beta-barrel protein [Xanthobacteraceae bacterium]|nr:autotransporter outer rane beta-barrel protein [Xanthobacteraceae bacterium]
MAGAVLLISVPASAQTIDTTTTWNGTQSISPWGATDTATYGQTITATATRSALHGFTFELHQTTAPAAQFQAFVYHWNTGTSRIDGPALYTSGVMVAPSGAGFTPVSIATGTVALTPGQQYVLFLTTSTVVQADGPRYQFGAVPGASYTGGQFVFQNNGQVFANLSANAWSLQGIDLAFIALLTGGGGVGTLTPQAAPGNPTNVAGAIDGFTAGGGTLPAGFQTLFTLSPSELSSALGQLSGETATGAQQSSIQLMNGFLSLLVDPFADTRGGFADTGPATAFAAEPSPLPPDVASAYAAITKAPAAAAPYVRPWSIWASAYGGYNKTRGDAVGIGSHDTTARAYGFATGVDYRVAPDTLVGFALSGGATSWGLADGLGDGNGDAFQAGVHATRRFDRAYLSGALAAAYHRMSTERTVTVSGTDVLAADFNAYSLGARIEGGYRYATPAIDVTPYAALQAQRFHASSFSESATSGSAQFALSFDSRSATAARSELGSRFDKRYAMDGERVLALFGRLAWAHDWVSDPALAATFQTLPGASFTVNGAEPASNLALVTLGSELRLRSGWSAMAKLDGEFGDSTRTYAGTGRLRYIW